MKKLLIVLLICNMILSLNSFITYAVSDGSIDSTTLAEINQNIKNVYNYDLDYYSPSTTKGSLKQITSTDGSQCLVYGSPSYDDTQYWHGNTEVRYLGYTKDGGKYANPSFPWDYGWDGTPIQKMHFVPTPWKNNDLYKKYGIKWNPFCGLGINEKDIEFQDNEGKPLLEDNIIAGLNHFYAGITGKELVPDDAVYPLNSNYKNKVVYEEDAEPNNATWWAEVTYVEQPPTDTMWGAGVMYIDNGGGIITYMDIPIAPFDMLEPETPITTDYEVPALSPLKSGIIQAMPRGNEKYDATVGIPSSEDLYIQISTDSYLVELETSRVTGTYTHHYTVSVDTGEKDADGNPIMKDERRSHKYPYEYSVIKRLEVFDIDYATVTNKTLPNEQITLTPNTSYYNPPSIEIKQDGGYQGEGFNGVTVWNDTLIIDGQTILDGSKTKSSITIPKTNENALYTDNITIASTILNKNNYESKTTVYYKLIKGINETKTSKQLDISTNSVTVHTPVICDGGIYSDADYDQSIERDIGRASVILGRANMIKIDTTGEHLNIRGYGTRDYSDYVKTKQVKFPFDIYFNTTTADKTKFLPANTWCNAPMDKDVIDIFIPTWVNEGDYTISYRTVAINAPNLDNTQAIANLDINNYVATDTSPVKVIGRLFGFKITDVEDYPLWEDVFRISADSDKHTDNYYYIGKKDCNGNSTGVTSPFTLPLLKGSHPTIINEGVLATGYSFKFELYTIGSYNNAKDCINITPTFYYVSKDGSIKKEVDLWYSEYFSGKSNYFVKIGSDKDKENVRYIEIGDADRNVPKQEITDTSNILGITEE